MLFLNSGRILKSCKLQTYGKHDNNNNNNIIIMINNSLFYYHCRQLKEYDNYNKMVIWKKENSYTRKLRKNNLISR